MLHIKCAGLFKSLATQAFDVLSHPYDYTHAALFRDARYMYVSEQMNFDDILDMLENIGLKLSLKLKRKLNIMVNVPTYIHVWNL